jgi:hypothetical protein
MMAIDIPAANSCSKAIQGELTNGFDAMPDTHPSQNNDCVIPSRPSDQTELRDETHNYEQCCENKHGASHRKHSGAAVSNRNDLRHL